jgi:hypothetical protein
MNGDTAIKAQIKDLLNKLSYPADKEEIVENGRERQATEKIIFLLKKLPDRKYDSESDVYKEINNFI